MKRPIGYISYTHGLDGKVKIVPMVFNSDFEKYVKNNNIYIGFQNKYEEIKINIIVFNGKVFLCKIIGIDKIEEAKRFLKKEIYIEIGDKNDFIDAEKLVGFNVFIENDKEIYGKIIDFGNYGSGMLIEIKTKKGKSEFYSCNNDEIKDIDYKNKIIIVRKREII